MRPLLIGLSTFVGILILTQILAYQNYLISKDHADAEAERAANFAKYKLTTALSHALSATKTLAYIVRTSGVPQNFDSVAQEIMSSTNYIDAIELTSKGVITHVYPLQGNESALGYDVLSDRLRKMEAYKAIEKNELFFAGPFTLKQGYSAVVGRLPIYDHREKFIGFSVVLIKTATLLDIIDANKPDSKVVLAKQNPSTQKLEFFTPGPLALDESKTIAVTVPNGEWILYVRPDDMSEGLYRFLPISVLGFLLAVITGFLAWYMAKQPIKVNRLFRFTSDVNHMMVNATDELSVYESICRIAIGPGQFRMAWVAVIDDGASTVTSAASAGDQMNYLDRILPIDLVGSGKNGPIVQMLKSKSMVYCNDIKNEPMMRAWADEALQRGYRSSVFLPIVQFGKITGSFNLYSGSLNAFDTAELKMLEEVGKDISYALENLARNRTLQYTTRQMELEKEKADSIINSLPGIFYMYDRTGRFVRWNKNFELVSGYTRAEIVRMTPLDFFADDEKALLENRIGEVFKVGYADVTASFYTKDKRKIPHYFNGRRVAFEGVEYLIGMGIDISLRVEAEDEVRESISEIQRLNDYLQNSREEERTNISREIHDVLGQHLTAIKMDTLWLSKHFSERPEVSDRIRDMATLIDETIAVVRKVSSQLRPAILDDLGLVAALEWQALEFEKRTGIATSFISSESHLPISPTLATNIFRIYQESLTNVARHANATRVDSKLEIEKDQLCITVADNGHGMNASEKKTSRSLGMKGMMERAKLFKGEISFLQNNPAGTVVKLHLPIDSHFKPSYELSDH
ncbi:MAG TPA: GAF domain-containing protein [Chryseosolibacter sp.]